MKFDVRGGFKIARKPNRHGIFDKEFWKQVSDSDGDLPGACGCYVFALQNGSIVAGTWERRRNALSRASAFKQQR